MDNLNNLLEALSKLYPDSSKRTLRNWLKAGRILVNDSPEVKASRILAPDDKITVGKILPPPIQGLPVLFEDEHIIVINKPANMLSVPLDKPGAPNVLHMLRHHFGHTIYPVHRLDKASSGLLVYAKTTDAREKLDLMFKKREVIREYHALVDGYVSEESGTWESPLKEVSTSLVTVTPEANGGKVAITHYTTLKRKNDKTLLSVRLETGRKHQIRVHCSAAQHPIIGDKKYKGTPYKRLCLHAKTLVFKHPVTDKKLSFTSHTPF